MYLPISNSFNNIFILRASITLHIMLIQICVKALYECLIFFLIFMFCYSPDLLLAQLSFALDSADVVISTGSVSMGDRDILRKVLIEDLLATVHFARVNMKPGYLDNFCYYNTQ